MWVPLVSALQRLVGHEFKTGLVYRFQDNQGYTKKPCPEKPTNKQNEQTKERKKLTSRDKLRIDYRD